MKTCVFIAIVVVGLSGGRFSDEKGCCLSSKTREKNVCRGRMIELSTEMAQVAEVDRGILWDEEGNWPEVLKSRACSRECPVVWPLWNQRSRFLVLTKRSAASGDENALAQEQENLCTCVEAYFKVIPSICMVQPYRASFLLIIFSAPFCTRILKTWRIALILSSASWKMAVAHQRAWAPHFFPVIVINSS